MTTNKPPLKVCPFMKELCIGEKCQLWMSFSRAQPGQVFGSVQIETFTGCAFVLQLIQRSPTQLPPANPKKN